MDGHTLCRNCGSKLIIKDKIEVGYQLNPLVKKSIDEGLIPIVLTLNFLQNLTSRGFMYLPGFKGKINKEPFDIDIIASCDGVLVFCECKNVPNTGSDWQEIKEQFEKLIRKSKKLKAQIVILSSLSKEYPEMIEELKKKYSSELNEEDLEKGIKYHPLRNGISFPFTISDFLPSKQTKRKKRRGKRSISYGNFL